MTDPLFSGSGVENPTVLWPMVGTKGQRMPGKQRDGALASASPWGGTLWSVATPDTWIWREASHW